jgi:antitoxin FitA
MSVNMHLRDVPDEVHAELAARATRAGMTLRQYVVDVLASHVELPTIDDWLDRVARRRVLALKVDALGALDESRAEDDLRVG